MKEKIRKILKDSIKVKELILKTQVSTIELIAKEITSCLKNGHKVILFGNGGSAADSQHLAA